ncbi:MAG: HAD-IA family hydrolase, partial [Actinomycetota bacterium]
VALVTSAPAPLARARMEAAGLPMPAVLVTAEDVTAGKPDPECYRFAASRLGVDPADCIVFEDAEAGIQAGLAAGATVVVVGEWTSPATSGLTRVRDYTGVRFSSRGDLIEFED